MVPCQLSLPLGHLTVASRGKVPSVCGRRGAAQVPLEKRLGPVIGQMSRLPKCRSPFEYAKVVMEHNHYMIRGVETLRMDRPPTAPTESSSTFDESPAVNPKWTLLASVFFLGGIPGYFVAAY